jgi:hypothetical protein
MNNKKPLLMIGYSTWCGLGFIRGIKDYTYNHNKYKKDYLYINLISNGFFGIIMYANPAFLPVSVYKEMYRLEVNLRNLQDEKNTSYYNNLI